jgi:hypothetical protein
MRAGCIFLCVIFAKTVESHVLVLCHLVTRFGDADSTYRHQISECVWCDTISHREWLQRGYSKGDKLLPREIALTNIKEDNMKMINDALPNKLITFLATR